MLGNEAEARDHAVTCVEKPAASPRVSIIIPVFNVEDYLPQAIESACSQTLSNIEIVCVDDGSTDGSPAILQAASAKDGRIRIVTQKNAGLPAARNVGLDMSTGDIVMFLDGDDKLVPTACECVSDAFSHYGAEIITFGAECFPEDAVSARLRECLSPRTVVYDGCNDDLLFRENSRPYVWRSAFSREFLQRAGIRFQPGLSVGEDQVFYFRAYPASRKTALISDKLYLYRLDRPGSYMTTARSNDSARVANHVRTVETILSDWTEKGWFKIFGWQTFGWLLEFVALDLYSLDAEQREPLKAELGVAMQRTLDACGVSSVDLPFGAATKRVLSDVLDSVNEGGSSSREPGRLTLYRFYLERRGLAACVKRMLHVL